MFSHYDELSCHIDAVNNPYPNYDTGVIDPGQVNSITDTHNYSYIKKSITVQRMSVTGLFILSSWCVLYVLRTVS